LFPLLLKYSFKSEAKLTQFWRSYGVQKHFSRPLFDFYLSLLGSQNGGRFDEVERIEKLHYPPLLPKLEAENLNLNHNQRQQKN